MISLEQLWIPIVASAVLVFVASSLIHMVFKWHSPDYLKLQNEDEVRTAIRKTNPPPGQYVLPYCSDMKEMQTPEARQKYTEGPVGFVLLRASGLPRMGSALALWFVLALVIAYLTAYLASRALPVAAPFLAVCRVVATVSFLAYATGSVIDGIWMGRTWRSVSKDLLDAVIYAAIGGITFGWLWPH